MLLVNMCSFSQCVKYQVCNDYARRHLLYHAKPCTAVTELVSEQSHAVVAMSHVKEEEFCMLEPNLQYEYITYLQVCGRWEGSLGCEAVPCRGIGEKPYYSGSAVK